MKSYCKVFTAMIVFSFVVLFTSLVNGQTAEELIKQGDNALDVEFNNRKALDAYSKANKISPGNWEVKWRLSRVYVYLGEQMPDSTSEQKDAQLAVYQKAYDYADTAIKLEPEKSVNYLRRAIANGRIALFKGIFSVAGVVNKVRADCEKAIELGNGGNYIQALAHYILARTNAAVSEKWAPARAIIGLGWASLDKAINEYNIAIKLYPNFRMFYLDLAKAYIRKDEYARARENLNKVISSPKRDENDDKQLAEAKELLNKIKNE